MYYNIHYLFNSVNAKYSDMYGRGQKVFAKVDCLGWQEGGDGRINQMVI